MTPNELTKYWLDGGKLREWDACIRFVSAPQTFYASSEVDQVVEELQKPVSIAELTDAESKLDELFIVAFEANHPAMLEYVKLKFVTKEVKRQNAQLRADLARVTEELEKANNPTWSSEPIQEPKEAP